MAIHDASTLSETQHRGAFTDELVRPLPILTAYRARDRDSTRGISVSFANLRVRLLPN